MVNAKGGRHIGEKAEYVGSHSQDFIPCVRGVSPATMMSLDVVSPFTKAPLDNVLAFLQKKLLSEDPRLPLPTNVFLKLIHLCGI